MQYDQENINAYLLGTAPESDTEKFDVLSVADDDFVDALNVAEDELVDAYVNGKLSGPTLQRFDSYYMASPIRRQKVEFARAFRQFTYGHLKTGAAVRKTADDIQQESFLFGLLRFPVMQWGFAAAAILLAAVSGWLALQNSELRRQAGDAASMRNSALEREQELQRKLDDKNLNAVKAEPEIAQESDIPIPPPLSVERAPDRTDDEAGASQIERREQKEAPTAPRLQIATFILTPPVRSGSKLVEFALPPKAQRAVFQIKMEPNEFKTHQVELIERSSGRAIWKSGRIRPSADTVSVNIPANLLNSGIYSFQVMGIAGSGDSERIGDYYFRIAN